MLREPEGRMNRRAFLRLLSAVAGTAAAPLGSRSALALGDDDRFQIAALRYRGGAGGSRPAALRRMLWEIQKRTSIDVKLEPIEIAPHEPKLFRYPLLYLSGDRAFDPLPDDDVARLRRHVRAGGMLLIDSAAGHAGGSFDRSVRDLCRRLLPGRSLERLDTEHVVFKSFYLINAPVGRVIASDHLEAVIHDDRAAVIYSQNDLGGAWARDELGRWSNEVVPGGEAQREQAFRLGINLAMYATCLDYKTDQVHVPFILRRRRWR